MTLLPTTRKLSLTLLLATTALAPAAEVFEAALGREKELPGGKEADGIRGDFILRSDRIEAVVSGNQPNRRANMSTFYGEDGISPGCLYDLTLRGTSNDQLVAYGPMGHGPVSYVRTVDGAAAVESVTTAGLNQGIHKKHVYRVEDGVSGLFISTTLRNETAAALTLSTKDDLVRFNSTGEVEGGIRWMDAINPAHRCGYALVVLKMTGISKIGGNIEIPAGGEVTVERFFAVGTSPAAAVSEAMRIQGTKLGRLQLSLTDDQNQGVASATITLPIGKNTVPAYPNAEGKLDLPWPAGDHNLKVTDLGRTDLEAQTSLKPDSTASLQLKLPAASRVRFAITDAAGKDLPCKAMFTGLDGTANPNLGPRERAHGCMDQYHSETGQFTVALPAGKYEVAVVRGPEYGRLAQVIELKSGEEFVFTGQLQRQVDTTGWVSSDFHNHSTPSGDNVCDTDGRIINLAAEHIEFAPTTEHNRLYDWEPTINALGLKPFLKTVKGMELTGRGQHFNSFPFDAVDPYLQDGGAPVWNADPRIAALTLRSWQGEKASRWIQFNHPDLANMMIDRNGDGTPDGGFVGVGTMIDGTETQNFSDSAILYDAPFKVSRKPGALAAKAAPVREFLWRQLLNQGHRLVAVAVADAHAVYGNGVGGWRIYLPSSTDQPEQISWDELAPKAKAGNIMLSSGPFLEVSTADGKIAGDDVRGNGGVDLKVRVQCADWLDIDRVQILVNSRAVPELNFTRESHPKMFADGVIKFDQTLHIPLQQDAHLIVVAEHRTMTLAKGFGTSDQAKLRPVAYNNPIYVDVDGGGFTPNGDTLGFELPGVGVTADKARSLLDRAGINE